MIEARLVNEVIMVQFPEEERDFSLFTKCAARLCSLYRLLSYEYQGFLPGVKVVGVHM